MTLRLCLAAVLVTLACVAEQALNDLSSPETYQGWSGLAHSEAVARCDSLSTRRLDAGEILVAFADRAGSDSLAIWPVTVLAPDGFRPTDSQELKFLDQLTRTDSRKAIPVRPRVHFDETGPDRCGWSAQAQLSGTAPAILASGEVALNHAPSAADAALFRQLRPDCVAQGDYPAGQEPPCSRPLLLAVSDLDANGLDEFWYTVPYLWDTGFDIAELNAERTELTVLASTCFGCD